MSGVVALEVPVASAPEAFAALRAAMGVDGDVAAGDRVVLTPGCLNPIRGVVEHATPTFLGVRSEDAVYRFYASGSTVGVAHHLYADDAEEAPALRGWRAFLRGACLTGVAPR
jgi:hypothetical protein